MTIEDGDIVSIPFGHFFAVYIIVGESPHQIAFDKSGRHIGESIDCINDFDLYQGVQIHSNIYDVGEKINKILLESKVG